MDPRTRFRENAGHGSHRLRPNLTCVPEDAGVSLTNARSLICLALLRFAIKCKYAPRWPPIPARGRMPA